MASKIYKAKNPTVRIKQVGSKKLTEIKAAAKLHSVAEELVSSIRLRYTLSCLEIQRMGKYKLDEKTMQEIYENGIY